MCENIVNGFKTTVSISSLETVNKEMMLNLNLVVSILRDFKDLKAQVKMAFSGYALFVGDIVFI